MGDMLAAVDDSAVPTLRLQGKLLQFICRPAH